jgi:C1A family cysteine protease
MVDPVQRTVEKYGWIPDLPDARDHRRRAPIPATPGPPRLSLRATMPTIYDQSSLGSCTANGIASLIEFDRAKQGYSPLWTPSRLQIYYNERVIENSISQDSGAMIRDGIKASAAQGVCDEALWPYDPTKFTQQPPQNAVDEAAKHIIGSYARVVQTIDEIRACLQSGFPIVFGFAVYNSFETTVVSKTGIMPMPDLETEQAIGGHCVAGIGYDDDKKMIECRNSWGIGWGDAGHFWMPYEFIRSSDFCDDLWHIDAVSS